jgi:hypothetical protein
MKKVIAAFVFALMIVGLGVTAQAEETVVPAQAVGAFCCDALGVRRCGLPYYYPIGSGCVCYGQGSGYVCY